MSPHGVALGERSQFGAVGGGLGSQLRRAQRETMLVQDLKAAAARGHHAARFGRGVRAQRLSEPAAGACHRRAPPSALRGPEEMTIGVLATAQIQRHPPGQQMRLRGLAGAERLQPDGRPARRAQDPAGRRAGRVLRLDQHEPGMGLSPGTLLRPEQAVGSLSPVQGCLRLRCGQRAVGCHQQQFGFLGRPAMGLLDIVHCGICLGQRFADQSGRQQHVASVVAEEWRRHVQRPVAGGGLVEE